MADGIVEGILDGDHERSELEPKEALPGTGEYATALAKYDEALKCAPNWQHLKDAREAIAKRKS